MHVSIGEPLSSSPPLARTISDKRETLTSSCRKSEESIDVTELYRRCYDETHLLRRDVKILVMLGGVRAPLRGARFVLFRCVYTTPIVRSFAIHHPSMFENKTILTSSISRSRESKNEKTEKKKKERVLPIFILDGLSPESDQTAARLSTFIYSGCRVYKRENEFIISGPGLGSTVRQSAKRPRGRTTTRNRLPQFVRLKLSRHYARNSY